MSDRVKPSRMEMWLVGEIADAPSHHVADYRRAEWAAYLSRLGRFEEARELLAVLRQRNESRPKVELSIRIHFAEGLLAYFSNGGVSNADGVQRAYALSVAAGTSDLQALCAAWLAQWDYTRVDIDTLRRHVVEALQLAAPEEHASRARANLVVAQVLHLAGRLDLAQPWYRRAREHATAGFDGATVGAIMHNMSWQRMLVLRQAVLTNADDINAGRHALLSAESTAHFDQMIGDSSWQGLKPILRAQIMSLRGDAKQALTLYDKYLTDEEIPERWQASLIADKGWCYAVSGQIDRARNCTIQALQNLADDTQMDDRAATHSRLSQTFYQLGEDSNAELHKVLAKGYWDKFSIILVNAVDLLSSIDENGNPV